MEQSDFKTSKFDVRGGPFDGAVIELPCCTEQIILTEKWDDGAAWHYKYEHQMELIGTRISWHLQFRGMQS